MAKAKRYTVICDICYSPVAKNVGIRAAERAATSHMNMYRHSVHIVPYTENPTRRGQTVAAGTLPVVRRGGRAPYTYVTTDAETGTRTVFYTRASVLRALSRMADGSTVHLSQYGAPVLLGSKAGTWKKEGASLVHVYRRLNTKKRRAVAVGFRRAGVTVARVSARGRRARNRRANPIPKGRDLGPQSFTLTTLRAVRRGGQAEKLWYHDARDNKHYYHDFGEGSSPGAVMYLCESAAVGKCVLIVSADLATPLWEDA